MRDTEQMRYHCDDLFP